MKSSSMSAVVAALSMSLDQPQVVVFPINHGEQLEPSNQVTQGRGKRSRKRRAAKLRAKARLNQPPVEK